MIYVVTITVRVDDKADLARAAQAMAAAGNAAADWADMRASHADPVAADLIMMLDPGTAPPGTEIIESCAEKSE